MIDRQIPQKLIDALERIEAARIEYLKHNPAFDAAKLAYRDAPNVPLADDARLMSAEDVKRCVIAHREAWAAFEKAMKPRDDARDAHHDAVRDAYKVFAECFIQQLPEEPQ